MEENLFKWIQYSIDIEEKSIKLYSDGFKKSNNHYAKELFKFLIEEESRHSKILNQLLHVVTDGNPDKIKKSIDDFKKIKVINSLFKDAEEISSGNAQMTALLNKAVVIEEQGIKFYSELEQKELDADLRSFFKRLVHDEENHKQIIRDFGIKLLGIGDIR
jgi:rubrerythrin